MAMTSYFRVQSGDRNAADLLAVESQTSLAWGRDHLDNRTTDRVGVSVCDSRESLAAYLAETGIPYGTPGWVLVELQGTLSDDQPLDADRGEFLIHPTEVVSVAPIDDEFFELISKAYGED
jgi:hypothetical protein